MSEIVEFCIRLSMVIDGMDNNTIMIFLCSFMYYVWFFRNKAVHSSEVEFKKKVTILNQSVDEFLNRGDLKDKQIAKR